MSFTAEEEVVRFEGSSYSAMPEVLDFSIHEGIISRGTKVVHTVDYAEEDGERRVLSNVAQAGRGWSAERARRAAGTSELGHEEQEKSPKAGEEEGNLAFEVGDFVLMVQVGFAVWREEGVQKFVGEKDAEPVQPTAQDAV